jgi:multidrug efflux pump subunit AcrB
MINVLASLTLAQVGSAGGVWGPVITFLQALLMSAGTLGIVLGAAMIAGFAHDEGKRALGWEIIGGSAMGLAIGLLAVPLYNLFDGWM